MSKGEDEEHIMFFTYRELLVINRALGVSQKSNNKERITAWKEHVYSALDKVEEKIKEIDPEY